MPAESSHRLVGLKGENGSRTGVVGYRPVGNGSCPPRWHVAPAAGHAIICLPVFSGKGIAQSKRNVTIGARRFPPDTKAGAPPEIR
jgi:hypothetical protein